LLSPFRIVVAIVVMEEGELQVVDGLLCFNV
jgi:hypothetical protein